MKENKDILWYDRKRFMWFPFSFTKYWVKNMRLYSQKGLLSTKYDEVLIYRVTDISLSRTLLQKIFGTGTIILTTRADTEKKVILENITKPIEVKDLLSSIIEEARNKVGATGKEFFEVRHNDFNNDDFIDDNTDN